MKKLLLILLCVPLIGMGQDYNFNDYKYVVIKNTEKGNHPPRILERNLKKLNFNVLYEDETSNYDDLIKNPYLAIYCHSKLQTTLIFTVYITFKDYSGAILYSGWGKSGGTLSMAYKSALTPLSSLFYEYNNKIINTNEPKILYIKNDTVNLDSEASVKKYFDNNDSENIEGIWEVTGGANYRISVIKDADKFKAYVLDDNKSFFAGDYKASFEEASEQGIFTINWIMGNKISNEKTVGISKVPSLIEFTIDNTKMLMYKIYPKTNKRSKKSGEWASNGSGIIISKSGYIITNHHVIDDADDIEVEFIVDDEVQKFNAEIVQVDKINDLAIIKIVDVNFDGVKELPYNFKTRSSDVGTKVYAFGYPMALSIMGKEIKVTDGIISSKTGFDGNITTYQITAPIQGGNSGGPLFDDKGNLIGINSSGIRKDIADNVGYSIKTSYVLNLIDILPKSIDLPSNKKLASLPLTEQIKEISKYVVLIKVK